MYRRNKNCETGTKPHDFYIPNYELFKQLDSLTKYLIVRAFQEGLFGL